MVVRRFEVRELSGIVAMTSASTLWDTIWFREGAGHEIDPALMVALAHAGGYLAGAFDGDTLVGAALGFWGSPDHGALHSHITGVLPTYAGRGIGTMIKNHQRDWVLARAGSAITWTYDPLVSRNAHVNLNRLGARPERYLLDVYGDLADDLNRGDPSDRLLVRWRLAGAPEPPSARAAVPLLIDKNGLPVTGPQLDGDDAPAVLTVGVPDDITALRRQDPATAGLWRFAVREALVPLLDRSWTITGFDRTHGYRVEAPPS
ncbi:MAG: GNAT family N-acetyltransferase [Microlunatus sp.]|nr:GNAT family N-acetyltransferase [Microlunatus sp.]MDN5771101.1 GNAT family N-acetyltransferase [Microlunatus sp.]MDN5804326.1 GNAT family N-acetyltransferase [Microlunatus sp.]